MASLTVVPRSRREPQSGWPHSGNRLPVDIVGVIANLDFCQLSQRDALTRRREQSNILDSLLGVTVRFLIAHDYVVDCLTLQDLADRITADRGLNCILDIGNVDAVARGSLAVNGEIDIRLARIALNSKSLTRLYWP